MHALKRQAMRWQGRGELAALLLCAAWLITAGPPPQALQPARVLAGSWARWRAVGAAQREPGYLELRGAHVVLRYRPADERVAPLVLQTAEDAWTHVAALLGHTPARAPLIVLHEDRHSLRAAYGWGERERALGVYSDGVIRLLSPRVWISTRDPAVLARVFRRTGPVAHELAHLVLDDATAGNYPHWFSEGVAQWVERHVSGFEWVEATALSGRAPYSLDELRRSFAALPNQALAYRQAFLLVAALEDAAGPDSLARLIDQLARGRPFEAAFAAVAGRPLEDLARSAWR